MKIMTCFACFCVVASALATAARAEDPPIPRPTAEHKILAAEEGTWDATIKSFEAGPESAPTVSKGVEVNTVMAGGLWVASSFKGDFGGMTFEGRGQYGYDPYKKKYVGTWVDSMSPSLIVLEGTYDAATKTLSYAGDGVCPIDNSKLGMRMVTVAKEDGRRVFTLYATGTPTGGKEAKMMEIEYTKRK
ncbi:hypothetical protein OJF2_04520 [Aquisphaera giovannonii]|uniref:DUF1579 domain-containing protein n=2 Tax=Aquisphaera giovannonii TaxID=406548 RepID=A0A5B9VW20_9BACT|nr:hypothetical protein OJF2_04520 [Aquisphaera giovannonii]